MNIKQHIEAGHYPTDSRGRALVPSVISGGSVEKIVTICATDKPGSKCLLGWVPTDARVQSIELAWDELGTGDERNSFVSLLPPPPRKVEVKAWAIIGPGGELARLRDTPPAGVAAGIERVIELTGSYEQEW